MSISIIYIFQTTSIYLTLFQNHKGAILRVDRDSINLPHILKQRLANEPGS